MDGRSVLRPLRTRRHTAGDQQVAPTNATTHHTTRDSYSLSTS